MTRSKAVAPTAQEINEAHRLARASAETAVQHAIRCGQMLIDVGADQAWVERHTEIAWSTAKRYVSAAKQNAQGIAFESLRHCFPSGKKAAPAAEKRGETATAVAKKGLPTAEIAISAPKIEPEKSEKALPAAAAVTILESSDSEDPERPDDVDEDAALAAAEADYQRRVDAVMGSDEKLAAAIAQVKQQSALIGTLETTRDGYMRGKEAVTQLLKSEQRKTAKLEKENAKLREQLEALQERIAIMEQAA